MTPKNPQVPLALIFDMDGVLVDSEPLHRCAKELAFREVGVVLPETIYDRHKGRPGATVVPEMLSERGISLDLIADVLHRKHQIFGKIEHQMKLVPVLRNLSCGRRLGFGSLWQLRQRPGIVKRR